MLSNIENIAIQYHQPKICMLQISIAGKECRVTPLCVFNISNVKKAKEYILCYVTKALPKWNNVVSTIEKIKSKNKLIYKINSIYNKDTIVDIYNDSYRLDMIEFKH